MRRFYYEVVLPAGAQLRVLHGDSDSVFRGKRFRKAARLVGARLELSAPYSQYQKMTHITAAPEHDLSS